MTTSSSHIPYSRTVLHRQRRASSYDGPALKTLAYPIGALAGGGCRLRGDATLTDWRLDADAAAGLPDLRVAFTVGSKAGARGKRQATALADAVERLVVAFPFANLQLDLPDLDARLEAFSPFVPLADGDSALPIMRVYLHLTNCSARSLTVDLSAAIESSAEPAAIAAGPLGPGTGVALPSGVLRLYAPDAQGSGGTTQSLTLKPKAEGSLALTLVWGPSAAAADATAADLADKLADLETDSRRFGAVLNSSTMPDLVREAVGAQLAELCASPRAQLADSAAMPYFFPGLSRRLHDAHAANQTVDQQLAGILRLYGDWMLCGDDEYLRARWPDITSTLEGLARLWDPERHGVLNGAEPTACSDDPDTAYPTINGLYLAALRAAEEMALQLDDSALAERYRRAFEQGRSWMEAVMFGGEFFRGSATSTATQASGPCVADQLLGQAYAGQWKLGHLLEPEMVLDSLESIYAYNWQSGDPDSGQPGGICLCAYPHGGAPPDIDARPACRVGAAPGAEFAFAGLLVQESLLDEGLSVVKAARDRCDGVNAPLWTPGTTEDDAGVRPLAAYGVWLACMDFFYSAPARCIHFAPKLSGEDFSALFSVDGAWGCLRQKLTEDGAQICVDVIGGTLALSSVSTGLPAEGASLTLDGQTIKGRGEPHPYGTIIRFDGTIAIAPGQTLAVDLAATDWNDRDDDPLDIDISDLDLPSQI